MQIGKISPATPDALLTAAHAAIDGLSEVPLDALSAGEIADALLLTMSLQQRCVAQAARLARRWETSMEWAVDGSKSAAAALSRDTGLSPRSCRRVLQRGAALESMTATAAAWADGEITVDQVDLLISARTPERAEVFERDEQRLVGHAGEFRYGEFVKVVAYWKHVVDAELGNDGTAPLFEQRGVSLCPGLDGETLVDGVLDPVGGAILRAGIDQVAGEMKRADTELPESARRTRRQLQADALVELVRRGIATPHGVAKPRILVTVAAGEQSFARLCELADGTVIGPADLVPYLDTVDVNAILFDGPNHAVVGSSQRCFTGLLRRAIEVRDRHCQEACGCDEPIDRCDVDHVVPYRHGGVTAQATGRLRCRYHNRIWANRAESTSKCDRLAGLVGVDYLVAWRRQAQALATGRPPP